MTPTSAGGGWARILGPGSPVIAVELLVFGILGVVVPYAGRPLGLTVNTLPSIEVADHVIPGVAVLLVAATALLRGRRTLMTSLVTMAAGGWMTATHIPLLRQAMDGQETMAAALWHSIPGFVILVIGVLTTALDAGDWGDRPATDAVGASSTDGQPSESERPGTEAMRD